MTEVQYTHQVQIFASSSVSLREVEQDFPFRHDEGIVAQRPQHTCIFMVGDLNDEQVEWLTAQKSEGKIKGWQVDPIRGLPGQGSRQPHEKNRDDSRPSEVTNRRWLFAYRKRGEYPEDHKDNVGKLLIFIPVARIDEDWLRIKQAVEQGRLGNSAKVSTARQTPLGDNTKERLICVYTYDWTDEYDVRRIHSEVHDLGFTWPISYKTDADTFERKYKQTGYTQIGKYRLSTNDVLAFKAGQYNNLQKNRFS